MESDPEGRPQGGPETPSSEAPRGPEGEAPGGSGRAALLGSREGQRERLKALVLDGVSSPESRRAYSKSLDDFLAWLPPRPFTKAAVQEYRSSLETSGLAPSTINLRLAPIRKLAQEASDNGLLDPALAAAIARVKGVRRLGVRLGNWVGAEEAAKLIATPYTGTLRGKRDRAILAVLIGCALRRSELVALTVGDLQEREGRAVFADIRGKGGRVRTVPVPDWVKDAVLEWTAAAGVTEGRLFRSVGKGDESVGESLTGAAVLWIVRHHATLAGFPLAPHDLRRTCARLCRLAGGGLEQIQMLLGHASLQTTERYLGSRQEIRVAVNDNLGIALPRRARPRKPSMASSTESSSG